MITHIGTAQKKALQFFALAIALLFMEVVMMLSYNAFWMVK